MRVNVPFDKNDFIRSHPSKILPPMRRVIVNTKVLPAIRRIFEDSRNEVVMEVDGCEIAEG